MICRKLRKKPLKLQSWAFGVFRFKNKTKRLLKQYSSPEQDGIIMLDANATEKPDEFNSIIENRGGSQMRKKSIVKSYFWSPWPIPIAFSSFCCC